MSQVPRFKLADLLAFPIIAQGEAFTLRYEKDGYRIWVSNELIGFKKNSHLVLTEKWSLGTWHPLITEDLCVIEA